MANNNSSMAFESVNGDVDDLSSWEFIIPSDSHSDSDNFSYPSDSEQEVVVDNSQDPTFFESPSLTDPVTLQCPPTNDLDVGDQSNGGDCFDDGSVPKFGSDISGLVLLPINGLDVGDEMVSDNETDGGDCFDDGDEYDEELVPKWVSDKFCGSQRMRKLGKRAYPKMNNSRKLPYYYSRPGCVYKY